jgi:hypothetical protein
MQTPCTNAVRGKSKRKSVWDTKFSEESLDDNEQVQVRLCSLVLSEADELTAIRQPLGIAGATGRARMGQILPAQQA